jgi:hypothetical protein
MLELKSIELLVRPASSAPSTLDSDFEYMHWKSNSTRKDVELQLSNSVLYSVYGLSHNIHLRANPNMYKGPIIQYPSRAIMTRQHFHPQPGI